MIVEPATGASALVLDPNSNGFVSATTAGFIGNDQLEKIVKVMNDYPTIVIQLGSHTDCRSSKDFNMKLSSNRAKASADYIKKKIKNPERIYGKGFGESKLKVNCPCEGAVKSNCSEEEHQKNRRTEFIIMKM